MHMSHTVSLEAWQEFLVAHAAGGALAGQVTDVMPFGAFVELGGGIVGLLSRSEWSSEVVAGSTISVRIAAVDLERRRVSLTPA
jgi:ribosomal protein S1